MLEEIRFHAMRTNTPTPLLPPRSWCTTPSNCSLRKPCSNIPMRNTRITAILPNSLERQFPIESPIRSGFTALSAKDFAEKLMIHVNHLNRCHQNHHGPNYHGTHFKGGCFGRGQGIAQTHAMEHFRKSAIVWALRNHGPFQPFLQKTNEHQPIGFFAWFNLPLHQKASSEVPC